MREFVYKHCLNFVCDHDLYNFVNSITLKRIMSMKKTRKNRNRKSIGLFDDHYTYQYFVYIHCNIIYFICI